MKREKKKVDTSAAVEYVLDIDDAFIEELMSEIDDCFISLE